MLVRRCLIASPSGILTHHGRQEREKAGVPANHSLFRLAKVNSRNLRIDPLERVDYAECGLDERS